MNDTKGLVQDYERSSTSFSDSRVSYLLGCSLGSCLDIHVVVMFFISSLHELQIPGCVDLFSS